jgi:hypothetical protein
MNTYAVGQLYSPVRTRWREGTQYNYRAGAHELIVFWSTPSVDEICAHRSAKARFALTVAGPVILLAFRFGDLPWCDAPYTWHMVPEDERDLPSADLEEDRRALVHHYHHYLVSAEDGVVRAIRMMTWSPEFTRTAHRAIRRQAEQAWDAREYDRALNALYSQHPTSTSLAKAAVASCVGGD